MKILSTTIGGIVFSTLIGVAFSANAASFRGLGDLPGGVFTSEANAISADGSVVVGWGINNLNTFEAFRWTEVDGMIGLGDLPGGSFFSEANEVSADGSVIVGRGVTDFGTGEAFRWTAADGMVALGRLRTDDDNTVANAVSADGSVIVGESDRLIIAGEDYSFIREAFRWTAADGMVGLGDLGGTPFDSEAFGVSADGSVVVGGSYGQPYYEPFRWTATDGMVSLGDLPGGESFGVASDVSADGSVVVGFSYNAVTAEAFRWTAADGMMGLGNLGGDFYISAASAVSADGSVVVGSSSSNSITEAFIWDRTNRMRSLKSLLTNDFGLDLSGWHLVEARDISADGLTIVGTGINPEGNREGWLARLDRIPVSKSVPEPSLLFGLSTFLVGSVLLKRKQLP